MPLERNDSDTAVIQETDRSRCREQQIGQDARVRMIKGWPRIMVYARLWIINLLDNDLAGHGRMDGTDIIEGAGAVKVEGKTLPDLKLRN